MARRSPRTALGLVLCLLSRAGAQDDGAALKQARAEATAAKAEAEAAKAEAEQLRAEKQDLQKALANAMEKLDEHGADQEHSVLKVAYTYGDIAQDLVQHLLDQTAIDELAYEHALTTHVMLTDALGNISNHATILSSQVIDTVSNQGQPYIDQYMAPVMIHVETIKTKAEPAITVAQDTYAQVSTVMTQVAETHLPTAREASTKALGSALSAAEAWVESATASVFGALERISPRRRTILPKSRTDRVLLLVCGLLVTLYCCYMAKFTLRISFKALKKLLKNPLMLPFKLLKVLLKALKCLCCCCCCCCCGSRQKTGSNQTNEKGTAQQATVDEITKLLQRAKDRNNLEKAVKELLNVATKGIVMEKKFTAEMAGKKLGKGVLKQAASKFKELDLKKIGL